MEVTYDQISGSAFSFVLASSKCGITLRDAHVVRPQGDRIENVKFSMLNIGVSLSLSKWRQSMFVGTLKLCSLGFLTGILTLRDAHLDRPQGDGIENVKYSILNFKS